MILAYGPVEKGVVVCALCSCSFCIVMVDRRRRSTEDKTFNSGVGGSGSFHGFTQMKNEIQYEMEMKCRLYLRIDVFVFLSVSNESVVLLDRDKQ